MADQQRWQPYRAPARWVEVLITLLGLLGLGLGLAFFDQAFPSAALDLKLSRDEITQRAHAYLQAQGFRADDYEFVLDFGADSWASFYLERALGVAETNRRVRAENLPIWYWHARWFKPLQKEEFVVDLLPDGTLLNFTHTVLETAPGAKISQEEARALAEKFLVMERRWNLAEWERVTASSEDRPGGRTDHHFEWKRRDFSAGEAELRLTVEAQGDRIGTYQYWLKTPESFIRDFEAERSRAGLFSNISYLLGFWGALSLALWAFAKTATRHSRLDRLGWIVVGVVGMTVLLAGLNFLPLVKSSYSTTEDYAVFWFWQFFSGGMGICYYVVLVALLWVGGQRLSKQAWKYQDKILPRGDDRWNILARSSWRGLMVGGISLGYTVLFYLAATRVFGGWTPLGSPYTNLFATPLPFIAPLASGILPATTEELMFRLIGVSFFLALTRRNRALALLIPGAVWAFAHLGYVRDPFYLRGVELTIAAVLIEGLFFYKFDLTTTMMGHLAYNAGLGALPLLRASDPGFVANGIVVVVVMLLPLAPGLVRAIIWRARGEKRATPLTRVEVATMNDADALSALGDAPWRAWLSDASVVVLCLRVDGEIVGAAAGRTVVEEGATSASVEHVFVAPRWRHRYIASFLVAELCAQFKAAGVEQARTRVQIEDKVLAPFWATQEWTPTAQILVNRLVAAPRVGWRERVKRIAGKTRPVKVV